MTRVCLDLFSGLGGFSSAFEESDDWRVVTVDINGEFDPDIHADVMRLRPKDLPDADVILASPPCTLMSTSGNHDEWDLGEKKPVGDRAKEHVALAYHTLGLIKAIAPEYWYLENPRLGRLRWLFGPPDEWVTYCQYGTEYMKPTGLWGEFAPMTFERCQRGSDCHISNTETDGTSAIASMDRSSHAERSKVPYELSEAIRRAVDGELSSPPPTQVKLGVEAYE